MEHRVTRLSKLIQADALRTDFRGKSTGKGNQLRTIETLALGEDDDSDSSENWLAFLSIFTIEPTGSLRH